MFFFNKLNIPFFDSSDELLMIVLFIYLACTIIYLCKITFECSLQQHFVQILDFLIVAIDIMLVIIYTLEKRNYSEVFKPYNKNTMLDIVFERN